MPIYEYECCKCHYHFETMMTIAEHDVTIVPCPKCSYTTDQLISKTNFKLEGTGWSKDGYQKRNSVVDNPLE